MKSFFQTWKVDLPSGLVVFLVALPLCLGIGLASTTIDNIAGLPNIFAGLIAGIVGGIVVGFISKSNLGVSGPAAGLITIVITSIFLQEAISHWQIPPTPITNGFLILGKGKTLAYQW